MAENIVADVTRHDKGYYIESDMVVFQVEGTLFRVPRYRFERGSGFFRDLFSLPRPPGDAPSEGSSDENPISVLGIMEVDFARLVEVMYPLQTLFETETRKDQEYWVSVLKLSHMWEFFEIRHFAIARLSQLNMTPIDKIIFAKDYKVSKWLRDGYQTLARRKETISIDEAKRLGLETTVRMFHVRDHGQNDDPSRIYYGPSILDSFELKVWINLEFKDELKELEAEESSYEGHLRIVV